MLFEKQHQRLNNVGETASEIFQETKQTSKQEKKVNKVYVYKWGSKSVFRTAIILKYHLKCSVIGKKGKNLQHMTRKRKVTHSQGRIAGKNLATA